MGRLPQFLLIGAMKAGTTSLASYIDRHPDVMVAGPKEVNYFADPGNWDHGLDWYKRRFEGPKPIAGEVSPHYTMVPEYAGAPERIADLLPDIRLIYLVRDPIERMRSMYVHRSNKYEEPASTLSAAIERHPAYVEISRYDRQLEPYRERFAEEQILVITTDELSSDPDRCLTRVFRHVGADPSIRISASDRLNQGAQKRRLSRVGYEVARIAKRFGMRRVMSGPIRRAVKKSLSSGFEETVDLPDEEVLRLRAEVRPWLVETRRMVAATGAPVPAWFDA